MAIFVGAIVPAVHWPVLRAQALSLDDYEYVTYNPLVSNPGWKSGWQFFREISKPSTVKGYYHPLAMTSLMADYAIGGRADDLRAFHRTSLALHVMNTVLVVLLLYRLFGALIPAAVVGLLFGLHPLTVEPTAWIGERKVLLAAFFGLASIAFYLRPRSRHTGVWWTASLVFGLLAMLSKPTAVMLPVLLLLLDYWPLRRLSARAVLEKWPFFLLSALFGAITLISQHRSGAVVELTRSDYLHWPLKTCYVLAFYLAKFAWPTHLTCIYPEPGPFSLSNPVVLLAVVGIFGLTVALAAAAGRVRGLLMAWLFFVLALAPTFGLVKYTWVIAFDNYVYFPALGMLMVLAFALTAAWESPRLRGIASKAMLLFPVLLVLAAEARGVRTTLRNWTDSFTLYRYMEKIAPDSPVVHNRLGILLEGESAHEEALRHLRRAIGLEPNYGDAHYNLGIVLGNQGEIGESIRQFRIANELLPDYPLAPYNLGAALRLAGRLDEAEAQFRRALRLNPDYLEAMDQLGSVLVMQGRTAEALEPFRRALTIEPTNAVLHFRMGSALVLSGQHLGEGLIELREAIRFRPDWPEPLNALAWLLATHPDSTVRDADEALRNASRAVELTGHRSPEVLDTMAAAQAAAGQFEQAAETARGAFELAERSHADALARGIRDRVKLYQLRIAYTEPVGVGLTPPAPPGAH